MDPLPQEVITLFDLQAVNYQQKNIDGMLALYAPESNFLFWGSDSVSFTSHEALRAWYESMLNQFEIHSVKYQVQSCWISDDLIGCSSVWQLETRLEEESADPELQSFRATHVLKMYDGDWKIVHLHSSAI